LHAHQLLSVFFIRVLCLCVVLLCVVLCVVLCGVLACLVFACFLDESCRLSLRRWHPGAFWFVCLFFFFFFFFCVVFVILFFIVCVWCVQLFVLLRARSAGPARRD